MVVAEEMVESVVVAMRAVAGRSWGRRAGASPLFWVCAVVADSGGILVRSFLASLPAPPLVFLYLLAGGLSFSFCHFFCLVSCTVLLAWYLGGIVHGVSLFFFVFFCSCSVYFFCF